MNSSVYTLKSKMEGVEESSRWHRGSHRNHLVWTTKIKLTDKSRRESWELVWLTQGMTFLLSHSSERVKRRAGETWRNNDLNCKNLAICMCESERDPTTKEASPVLAWLNIENQKTKERSKTCRKEEHYTNSGGQSQDFLGGFSIDAMGPEERKLLT